MRTRRLVSLMDVEYLLYPHPERLQSAHLQPRASRTDVDMCARCFAGYGVAEGKIRDVILHQILEQPMSFRLIGVNRDIDPAAVIEAHRAVYRGLPHRAHRKGFAELPGKFQVELGE